MVLFMPVSVNANLIFGPGINTEQSKPAYKLPSDI